MSRAENRNADARKQYEEALDIRRALAQHNPDVYVLPATSHQPSATYFPSTEKASRTFPVWPPHCA